MTMAIESSRPRVNFDEEDMPPPRQSPITRVGGALGKSVVTVWRNTTPDAVKDVWRLARWETQNVRCWRTLIFLLLLITGAFVSSYTYIFLRKEQDSDFESNVCESNLDMLCGDDGDSIACRSHPVWNILWIFPVVQSIRTQN